MTQEEKAKAYDEALGWMREMYPCLTDSLREDAEHYFPELAESEDERIRKELKEAFEAYDIESKWNGIPIRSILAWLEKQKESLHFPETCEENANSFTDGIIEVRSFQRGMEEGRRLEKQKEQKQAQTSDEKEYIRTIKSIISDFIRDKKPENLAYYQRIYDWLDGRHVPFSCGHENDKPAEWSAEDEEMLDCVISDVNDAKQLFTTKEAIDLCDEEIAWLKSLRPSWKPSEEQMDTLKNVAYGTYQNGDGPALRELYEQLVKNYKL